MNYNNIPEEMRELNQWACFFLKWDEEKNKYKKVIINPETNKCAYCNDPETWSDFETAKRVYESKKYKGLVFALTKDIVFIDIDHAIDKETGEIVSKEANELLALFPDTFTEKSVSGTGIHILARGNLPENALKRNDKKGLEMYDTKRFICMTGELLKDSVELTDYSNKIEEVNLSFIGKRPERVFNETISEKTDMELVEAINRSKQSEKFQRLYSGNTAGYPSHSNADFALAAILAWWTQDFNQIDRIFRSSGLMREKWDRRTNGSTYGENLINAALGIVPSSLNRKVAGLEM